DRRGAVARHDSEMTVDALAGPAGSWTAGRANHSRTATPDSKTSHSRAGKGQQPQHRPASDPLLPPAPPANAVSVSRGHHNAQTTRDRDCSGRSAAGRAGRRSGCNVWKCDHEATASASLTGSYATHRLSPTCLFAHKRLGIANAFVSTPAAAS